MNNIKLDESSINSLSGFIRFIKENKWCKEFFNNKHNQDLINNNQFDDLYREWGSPPVILTAILIKANIDFMPYITKIWSNMFSGLPINKITVPNNIKHIEPRAFNNTPHLHTIYIDDSLSNFFTKVDNNVATFSGLFSYLGINENRTQIEFNKE